MKRYLKLFFQIFFFYKHKELKSFKFKKKNDFYDSKQTEIALDFFKNL